MKHIFFKVLVVLVWIGLALSSHANILVNDTWQDGTRTDPASPVYAENNGVVGTDADNDGDIESAWFASTGGSSDGCYARRFAGCHTRKFTHVVDIFHTRKQPK